MPNSSSSSLLGQAKRRSLFTFSLLIFVTSILVVALIVYPQITHILETKDKIEQKQKQIAVLENKVKQIEQTLLQSDYLINNETVELALPSSKPLLEMLMSLDQVKRATEVEVFDIETQPGLLATASARVAVSKRQSHDNMPLEFTLKATFDQVTEFMDLLEKISPFTTLTKFEISGGGSSRISATSEGSEEIIQVAVESKTYFFNPSVNYSMTAPLPKLSQESSIVLAKLSEFTTIPLPEQFEITGGGLEDLFGIESIITNP